MTRDAASDRQQAEQRVGQLIELNYIRSSEGDAEQDKEEWLQWIPERPEKKGTALNMLYRWQGKTRSASEVCLYVRA